MKVELLRGKTIEAGLVLDQAPIASRATSAVFLGESAIRRVNDRPEAMAVKAFNTDANHMDEGLARRESMIHLAFGGHPNIITPYGYSIKELRDLDTGEFPRIPVLAMEYASAGTVKQRLHAGEISLSDAVRIASETAYALQSLHDGGYVHRDIAPKNIGLVPSIEEGVRYHARVLDFGLAMRLNPFAEEQQTEATLTELTRQIAGGTPGFIAPEQVIGKAEPASDGFSLAQVMRHMMDGKDNIALAAVVARELSGEPEDRYPEIAEFGEELLRAHSGAEAVAARDTTHIDLGSVRARLAAEAQAVKGQAVVNTARAEELNSRESELSQIVAEQHERESGLARQYQLREEQINALGDLRAAQRAIETTQNNREEELRTQAGELDDQRRALSSGELAVKAERVAFDGEIEQLTTTLGKRADKLGKEEEKSRKALDKREQGVREGEQALQRAEADSLERIKEEESAARERIHGEREVLQGEIAGERHELEEQARVIGERGELATAREQRVGEREVSGAQRDTELDERERQIRAEAERKNAELDAKAAALRTREDEVDAKARANETRARHVRNWEEKHGSLSEYQEALQKLAGSLSQREQQVKGREDAARKRESDKTEEILRRAEDRERLARQARPGMEPLLIRPSRPAQDTWPRPQSPVSARPERPEPHSVAETDTRISTPERDPRGERRDLKKLAMFMSFPVVAATAVAALLWPMGGEEENPAPQPSQSKIEESEGKPEKISEKERIGILNIINDTYNVSKKIKLTDDSISFTSEIAINLIPYDKIRVRNMMKEYPSPYIAPYLAEYYPDEASWLMKEAESSDHYDNAAEIAVSLAPYKPESVKALQKRLKAKGKDKHTLSFPAALNCLDSSVSESYLKYFEGNDFTLLSMFGVDHYKWLSFVLSSPTCNNQEVLKQSINRVLSTEYPLRVVEATKRLAEKDPEFAEKVMLKLKGSEDIGLSLVSHKPESVKQLMDDKKPALAIALARYAPDESRKVIEKKNDALYTAWFALANDPLNKDLEEKAMAEFKKRIKKDGTFINHADVDMQLIARGLLASIEVPVSPEWKKNS